MSNQDLIEHWLRNWTSRRYCNMRCNYHELYSYDTVIARRLFPWDDKSQYILLLNQTYYSPSTHRQQDCLRDLAKGRPILRIWEQPRETTLNYDIVSLDAWYRARSLSLQFKIRNSDLPFQEVQDLFRRLADVFNHGHMLRCWMKWPFSSDLTCLEEILHVPAPDPQLTL